MNVQSFISLSSIILAIQKSLLAQIPKQPGCQLLFAMVEWLVDILMPSTASQLFHHLCVYCVT